MIFVGSLKYSPVYKSHCCAFGEACEKEGHSVRYLFSGAYEWMLPKQVKEKSVFVGHSTGILSMLGDTLNFKNIGRIKEIFLKDEPTNVYLHNYHLLNHFVAGICKKHGCKFIYHAHEPYVENKSVHGGLQHYWLYLSEYMEAKLLRNTDVAIVSSKEGSRLFDKAYPWFQGKKVVIPLMYEDTAENVTFSEERKYITFVGPPVPAKSPEIFLNIVDYAASHKFNWSFLLISREKITDPKFLKRSNLSIYYKERISDEEYGDLMRRSLAVLTPYKRETQSSVVLVSYMHGTPVVSSNVGGLPEFVDCGRTGYIVDDAAPVEKWVEAIGRTLKDTYAMRANCRNYFVENFSGKNWRKYLDETLA
jgi:glycosyltransferase involved in cell wall biosynthesis